MPEMDGFEVLAIMNKNKWIERVPGHHHLQRKALPRT